MYYYPSDCEDCWTNNVQNDSNQCHCGPYEPRRTIYILRTDVGKTESEGTLVFVLHTYGYLIIVVTDYRLYPIMLYQSLTYEALLLHAKTESDKTTNTDNCEYTR